MFMDPAQFGKNFMDPTEFNKQFYGQMEQVFIEKMNEMIKNPAFLSSISKGVETGLDGKKKSDDLIKKYLEKMNMPTREDTSKILQYLQKIETKILDLEDKIEDLSDDLKNLKKEYGKSRKKEKKK